MRELIHDKFAQLDYILIKIVPMGDKAILNRYGYILKNKNAEDLRIKYYIELPAANDMFPNATDLIITKNYRIIYIDDKNVFELKIYNKMIEEIEYKTMENNRVRLEIEFEDKSYAIIDGYYTEYYGFEKNDKINNEL